MPARQRIALALLAMLPVAAAADLLHLGDGIVFVSAILSIIPLAIWLSTATEELSITLGPPSGPCSTPCSATPPNSSSP